MWDYHRKLKEDFESDISTTMISTAMPRQLRSETSIGQIVERVLRREENQQLAAQ